MSDITLVLQAVHRGEKKAAEELLPLVYEELRRSAEARMAREASGQTLQPTALVHEAWVRLVGSGAQMWDNRGHFFSAASEAMRRILIERARRKARLRHGGGLERVDALEIENLAEGMPDDILLLLDETLKKLEAEYPERARVVVLKFFGGLTNLEVAEAMGIGERSVDRHWHCAKTWLYTRLRESQ